MRELVLTSTRLVEMTEARDAEFIALAVAAFSLRPFIHSAILSEVEKRRLLRFFWIALLATFITRGRPSLMPRDLQDMMASQLAASHIAAEVYAAQALSSSQPLTLVAVSACLGAIHDYPRCKSFFLHTAQLCLQNSPEGSAAK